MNSLRCLLQSYPRFSLTLGEMDIYRRFRVREAELVSCMDEKTASRSNSTFEVLTFKYLQQPVGVASVAVGMNQHKSGSRNRYGRIDLVIVDENFRGFGIGRVLVLSAIDYLLEEFRNCLYGISCLAAHPAIEKLLETELGFRGEIRDGMNFKHESFEFDDESVLPFYEDVLQQTARSLQATAFRLRQVQQNQ